MRVLKFGGTSVKDASAISQVINIVRVNDNHKKVVIVSAFSKVTDSLIDLYNSINQPDFTTKLNELKAKHKQVAFDLLGHDNVEVINREFNELEQFASSETKTPKLYDFFISKGERLSSEIICEAMRKNSINATHKDSAKLIETDSNFGEANVNFNKTYSKINAELTTAFQECDVVICGGFISSHFDGLYYYPTTLGRGGSDYSGAIYAGAMNADILEIWTDVDGILTCDPRLIKNTKRIKRMSYSEAGELAYFGAKVLHPKTILPAIEKNIPVVVKNTFNPDNSGTMIVSDSMNISSIKAIAFRRNITIINITSNRMLGAYGFLYKVFEIFKKHETSVDIVTTSEVSISLTIDNTQNLTNIITELEQFSKVETNSGNAVISVVGDGIKLTAGIAAKFFGVLKGINILMVSFGASEVNLTITVKEEDLENSVNMLHSEFFDNNLNPEVFE